MEKLRRIEALHARPGSEGERQAAERARERIQARLKQLEAEEPPIEFRFTLADQWSRHLFVALMRRYGIRPYRYRGQRRTTVMARLSRSFVNDTLWPEFLELQSTRAAYFDDLTDRGQLTLESVTFLRGRSLQQQFVVVDEAQNLEPTTLKTILTRIGEGTKVVFTGDTSQIDAPYMGETNNALAVLIHAFAGQRCFGHVTLAACERSEVASLAAELL